jgi:coproporphyrinogen III oxidase-like Fe-S oxidoreductase
VILVDEAAEHRNGAGYELAARAVEVEQCDEVSRVAAALVNGFFQNNAVDASLIEAHSGVAPEDLFATEFDYLLAEGVLRRDGRRFAVAPQWRGDWCYMDKLFYPPDWIERRARSTRLRIR